jgi:glycosyltransferase involved in cell wall biosynthesis
MGTCGVNTDPKRWIDHVGPILRSLSAHRATAALCVSEPLVRYAHDLGIQQVTLVPNGSDLDMFKPELRNPALFPGQEHQFRVLWAGSTGYGWHDFETVLASAAQIQSIDPSISFVVVGNQPNLAADRIPSNVHFYPPVPYLEVPPYFASADVGLCIYKTIDWSRYGFFFSPLKLFDYAASGLPVVYTDSPELDRVASPFGLKVGVGDVDGLTNQILQLKQETTLHARLSQQARQQALDYSNWARVGLQTEQILQSVVQQAVSDRPSALAV